MMTLVGLELPQRARKLRLALALCAALGPASAYAASEAIAGYTDSFGAYGSETVGWTFQCSTNLVVMELGCFAKAFDANPFLNTLQIGLWDQSGSLVASNEVNRSSTLIGEGRYELIDPVSLVPGQVYHLGAYAAGASVGIDVAGAVAGGTVATAPEVQLVAAASASAGFVPPQEIAGASASIYAGPNFTFQTRPTLEIRRWPGNRVRLSWPTAFTGYTLQSEIGLSGTWTNSGLTVTNTGSLFLAFDGIGAASKFYRLVK